MILLGLGSNLRRADGATPAETVRAAAAIIGALPGLRAAALSRLWDSAPVPASDQPRFVNAVLRAEGEADPAALLAALHAIEARFGRVRGERNAARTLDLDLLDLDGLVRSAPSPVLPHPRLAQRAFVLAPLAEVAPGWRHPVTGEAVETLLAALPAADREACRPLGTGGNLA
ncbi:MAG: 2-amino-4-hydroxy-6-hydroxymethyldihydropteridine diphosphokinase [Acetobacteraceae bacterium]|nr:2-amino-4-hydroxy-6-hydroxymethyldihydropteridine diphosphokinase [Acetobacteraceae bacterium]